MSKKYEPTRLDVYGVDDVTYSLLVKETIENTEDHNGLQYRVALLKLDLKLLRRSLDAHAEVYRFSGLPLASPDAERLEATLLRILNKIDSKTEQLRRLLDVGVKHD